MLSKRGYLVHFARIFFASLLLGLWTFLSYLWNTYQPIHVALQLQQCQSSISAIKLPPINIWNWLNHFHLLHLLPSFSFLFTSKSSKCHLYIKNNYSLNINKFNELIYSVLLIYLFYHLICLLLFHTHIKQIEDKQRHYAYLYCQDQKTRKSRCSNRLLLT